MVPKLRISVDGDEVEIIGPRDVVKQAVDVSLLNYVEIDGFIVTQFRDPVEHAGRMAANGALLAARRGRQGIFEVPGSLIASQLSSAIGDRT